MSLNDKKNSLSIGFLHSEESKESYSKWGKVKSELKNDFKSIIWNSWIGPLQFLTYHNNILTIIASSELVKNRIEHQYYEQIFLRCKNNFSNLNKIKFVINDENERNKKSLKNNSDKIETNFYETSLSFVNSVSKSLNKEYNFNNFVTDESNELAFLSSKKVSQNFSSIYN